MLLRTLLVSLVLTAVLPPTADAARRWTFFEGHLGGSTQAIDADFRDTFGPSLVAGVRTGAFYCGPEELRIGWEAATDFTLFDYEPLERSNVYRLRLLGGARMERPFLRDARLVYRVLGGIDYIISSTPSFVAGTETKEETSSLGPVVEPGIGIVWQFGEVLVGANATLPLSYHRDTDARDYAADFDFIGVELDLLFTVGASL
jgi:hypothetical protein